MPGRPAYSFFPLSGSSLRQRLPLILPGLLVAIVLVGCAGQTAYRDGQSLVAQDKVEEGLSKFQEALGHEPRNVEYMAAYRSTHEKAITSYLEQADRFAAGGKHDEAEKRYLRVLGLEASNERARSGLRGLTTERRHEQNLKDAEAALDKKDVEFSKLKLSTVLAENPNNVRARDLQRTIAEANAKPTGESVLSSAYKRPITIEFKDVALKQVFEVIARTSGLNFLFDKDVKTDQKTSIFLKNSTIESAVQFTLLTNQLEQQVLDANTVLIYPNTAAKLKDYQEMVVRTFFLGNADAKAVANTLKTIVKSRDVVIDEKLNMLIVRDSPEAIRMAEKLVALQDVAEPEVMLEVEILEVKRTRLLELGIKWPENLTLTALPTAAGGSLTLRDLGNLNGGTIGAAISPLAVNARKQDGAANILANPRIRARNHEKAKILIGERVPNITTTATSTGFVSESINYVDVGLKLDVEPTIYLDGDVAIKVALEVSNIINQLKTPSGSVAYQIGTRTASTVLRLKDGETQVLAGLINDEDRRTGNKVPGLGELPIVGRLFGNSLADNQKTEIVLSITPHLIRNIQRPHAMQAEFRAGTDSSLRVRPDVMGAGASSSPSAGNSGTVQAAKSDGMQPPPRSPNSGASASTGDGTNAPVPIQGNSGAVTRTGPANTLGSGIVETHLQWQGPAQLKLGDTFSLQLSMQSEQPITSLPMAVNFDSRLLQVTGIVEGEFLKQGGALTSFTSRIDPKGQILITGTRSGDSGATSLGTVATINFRTLASTESSNIQLLSIAPMGLAGHSIAVPLPPPYIMKIQP